MSTKFTEYKGLDCQLWRQVLWKKENIFEKCNHSNEGNNVHVFLNPTINGLCL
jgi:hypothetical protein